MLSRFHFFASEVHLNAPLHILAFLLHVAFASVQTVRETIVYYVQTVRETIVYYIQAVRETIVYFIQTVRETIIYYIQTVRETILHTNSA